MACIDKTYILPEQVESFFIWFESTQKKMKKDLGYIQHLYYSKEEYLESKTESVLWNTGTQFDIWLTKNCRLDFITI